jgi:hypothetical protein
VPSRSESARAGRRCRGCMAGCGAWVATRCWVGVLVHGCRGGTVIGVSAGCVSNQPSGTLPSSRLPIRPPSPLSWCGGRDRQTWHRIDDQAAVGRTPQWTGGTPPEGGTPTRLRGMYHCGHTTGQGQLLREPRWQARHARTRRAGPPENTRPPRPRPFGPQTEQNSLPLTDQERYGSPTCGPPC